MKKYLKIHHLQSVFTIALFCSTMYAFPDPIVVHSRLDYDSMLIPGDNTARLQLRTGREISSFRSALQRSNVWPGADTIIIAVTGIIQLKTALPDITDPAGVVIIGPGSDKLCFDAWDVNYGIAVLRINNADHVTISGLSIINIAQTGISIVNAVGGTFDDVVLRGRGTDRGSCLMEFIASSHHVVQHCSFSDGGLGLRFNQGSDHNQARYCRSINNQHSGITVFDSDYNYVHHNYVAGSDDFGMYVIFGSNFNCLENNTVIDNQRWGITLGLPGSDGSSTGNNILCGNMLNGNLDGDIFVEGSIDDLFVDNIEKSKTFIKKK